ncbi:MAG: thioredoxin [Kibdelosporangium sp.]
MHALTDETFEDHLKTADRLVLVDFWATWCGPCRMVAPVLAEIAAEHADVLEVVKVDVDACPQTARDQQVMGMPTMSLYRDGQLLHQIVGARPKAALLRELAPHLAAVAR